LRYFDFYLDAWNYCIAHKINVKRIVRLDWDSWGVTAPKKKKANNVHKQRQVAATKPTA
jgi:hypothetical protein